MSMGKAFEVSYNLVWPFIAWPSLVEVEMKYIAQFHVSLLTDDEYET